MFKLNYKKTGVKYILTYHITLQYRLVCFIPIMSIGPLVRAMYDQSANVNPENQNPPSALPTLTHIFLSAESVSKGSMGKCKTGSERKNKNGTRHMQS